MPTLEKRRIIKQRGSYTVAMPQGWLRFYQLGEGNFVEMKITDEGLMVRPWETSTRDDF